MEALSHVLTLYRLLLGGMPHDDGETGSGCAVGDGGGGGDAAPGEEGGGGDAALGDGIGTRMRLRGRKPVSALNPHP